MLAMFLPWWSTVVLIVWGILVFCLLISGIRTIPMQQIELVYYYYQISQLYDKNTNPQQVTQTQNISSFSPTQTLQPSVELPSEKKWSWTFIVIFLLIIAIIGWGYFFLKDRINLSLVIGKFTSFKEDTEDFQIDNPIQTQFNNQFDNQWPARDTARSVALSQIQTATASYRSLHGKRPETTATNTNNLTIFLEDWLLSELPQDPAYQKIENAYQNVSIDGDFLYIPVKKNGKEKGGVVLAAKMETQQRSNYVSTEPNKLDINEDWTNIFPCKEIQIDKKGETVAWISNTREGENLCIATSEDQLWYVEKV